ncbi:MAG: hypothetical protein H7X79_06125 [Sporomusaceae bacterium]|nr:hypothetical protein [Sporomusaceae bacterium]
MTLLNFIIMNVVIAIVWFLLSVRRQKYQAVCEFFIIALLPGAGMAFLVVSYVLKSMNGEHDPAYLYQEFKHEQKVLRRISKQENDIIPVSDVLMLDDNKTKRTVLGDVIKSDVLYNREILFDAVGNADSEVSHYAVAVITNRLAELENLLYAVRQKNRQKPNNPEILRQYADHMYRYLQMSNLDRISRQKYEQEYADMLENLIFLDGKDERYFCELINCYLRSQNFTKMESVCGIFQDKFPLSEEPYLHFIKLYYYLRKQDALVKKIVELKQTNIKITNQTLEVIRFWDGGSGHAS